MFSQQTSDCLERLLRDDIMGQARGYACYLDDGSIRNQDLAGRYLYEICDDLNKSIRMDLGLRPLFFDGGVVSLGFAPEIIGRLLAKRALREGRVEGALEWMTSLLNREYAYGLRIVSLWGVTVNNAIQLTDEVSVAPITDLPDSWQKRFFVRAFERPWEGGLGGISRLVGAQPNAALVVRSRVCPLVHSDNSRGPLAMSPEARRVFSLTKEVALALSAVGPRDPIIGPDWFVFNDVDVQEANTQFGLGESQVEFIPARPVDFPPLQPEEASEIVRGYLGLQEDVRNLVRVGLKRISQALRRHHPGDCAIELAIAFEALMGGNEKNEVTHKVRVRTARILGGTPEERIRTSEIVNRTYGIRSAMVHSGAIDLRKRHKVGDEYLTADQLIPVAADTCATLIRAVIRAGALPDWSSFDVSA